jgi:serine/threonine protein kinase
MDLQPGLQLAHYRLIEKIGEGGMGVVWKALDTTLDREVAIKVLPPAFTADEDRLSRFQREARLLASLNHPSIAGVYGLHQHESVQFLVMELVPGEELAEVLNRGPLPLDQALSFATGIAEALEAAHQQGVVHRDLKPANVKITPEGKVKVLDFGLAKAMEASTSSDVVNPSLSPTVTSAGTVAGVILGTAAYMSPEQARGRPVDQRADVWAFGAVFYEMLTGRRMFGGETVSDSLAAVLKTEPDWQSLPATTPQTVRRLLGRCLTKDPDRRLPQISAARFELQEMDGEPDEPEAAATTSQPATSSLLRFVPWVLVLILAVAAGVGFLTPHDNPPSGELINLAVPFPPGLKLPPNQMDQLAVAPDGRSLAVVLTDGLQQHIYLKKMDSGRLQMVPETATANTPFYSPDSRWLGFFADGKIKKVSVDGGRPVTICDTTGNNRGVSWGEGDNIIFSPFYAEPLYSVPGTGGIPQPVTELDMDAGDRTHRWPQVLPGGEMILFTVGNVDSSEFYDRAHIDVQNLATGERRTILEGASLARYLPGGQLIFAREGFLFAVPFDIKTLEATGSPIPVVENVRGARESGIVYASIAAGGTLVYAEGFIGASRRQLIWRYLDGRSEALAAPVNPYAGPALSPDGNQVAVGIAGDRNADIWTYDIPRQMLTRLTFEGDNKSVVWSQDGSRVAFSSSRDDRQASVYSKAADGSGSEKLLYSADRTAGVGGVAPRSWSPDNKWLAVVVSDRNQGNIIAYSPADETELPILDTPAQEELASFSPDGRWLAYTSNDSGRHQVYVRAFPGPGSQWQISVDGGIEPRWTRDGKQLFFRNLRQLLVADIDTSSGFAVGRPRMVLDDLTPAAPEQSYSVAPDGEKILLVEALDQEMVQNQITVILNWTSTLTGGSNPAR